MKQTQTSEVTVTYLEMGLWLVMVIVLVASGAYAYKMIVHLPMQHGIDMQEAIDVLDDNEEIDDSLDSLLADVYGVPPVGTATDATPTPQPPVQPRTPLRAKLLAYGKTHVLRPDSVAANYLKKLEG